MTMTIEDCAALTLRVRSCASVSFSITFHGLKTHLHACEWNIWNEPVMHRRRGSFFIFFLLLFPLVCIIGAFSIRGTIAALKKDKLLLITSRIEWTNRKWAHLWSALKLIHTSSWLWHVHVIECVEIRRSSACLRMQLMDSTCHCWIVGKHTRNATNSYCRWRANMNALVCSV